MLPYGMSTRCPRIDFLGRDAQQYVEHRSCDGILHTRKGSKHAKTYPSQLFAFKLVIEDVKLKTEYPMQVS